MRKSCRKILKQQNEIFNITCNYLDYMKANFKIKITNHIYSFNDILFIEALVHYEMT